MRDEWSSFQDQQGLSNRFAKPSVNNWEGVSYRTGDNGCARLADVVGTLECARRAAYPGGDHVILVGEVQRFEAVSSAEPLLFYQGGYGTFTRDQSGVTARRMGLSRILSITGAKRATRHERSA